MSTERSSDSSRILTPSDWRAISRAAWRTTPAGYAQKLSRGSWIPARHLVYLSDRIAPLVAAGNARIIVTVPVRHGKSKLLCQWLPVWFEDLWPDKYTVLASYGSEVATDWGRRVRDTFADSGGLSRVRVRDDSASAARWHTNHGGGLYAVGVRGPLTGRGGDLMVLDDPYKDDEEAFSTTHRDKVLRWYQTVFRTRLEPGGSIVVSMARWHFRDLVGQLVDEATKTGAEPWTVISLPGLALESEEDPLGRAPGEALWPERYSAEALRKLMVAAGPYGGASLVQQRPPKEFGTMFRRSWFEGKLLELPPSGSPAGRVRRWDLAATAEGESADPDWTTGALCELREGRLVVIHLVRVRASPGEVEKIIRATAQQDGRGTPVRMEEEGGASGKSLIDHYRRSVLVGYDFDGKRSTGSKVLRAKPLSAMAEAGNVLFVRGPWNTEAFDEMELFPGGRHDDVVDVLSGALEDMVSEFPDPEVL